MVKYIDPFKEGMHPRRLELSDDEMADILQGIADNEDWMTLEDVEAAADYLFDHISSEKQTHLGEVILQ